MYPLTFVQPAYCFTIWLDQVSKIIRYLMLLGDSFYKLQEINQKRKQKKQEISWTVIFLHWASGDYEQIENHNSSIDLF